MNTSLLNPIRHVISNVQTSVQNLNHKQNLREAQLKFQANSGQAKSESIFHPKHITAGVNNPNSRYESASMNYLNLYA